MIMRAVREKLADGAARIGRAASYLLLTALAALLFVPMIWMVLGAFAPQSELQTAIPMKGTFAALGSPGTLTTPSGMASWVRTYLTTENFASSDGKNGLFDITAMRESEFRAAPVHAWAFGIYDRVAGPPPASSAAPPIRAARLLLWFENTLVIALVVTVLSVLLNGMAGYGFAKFDFPGRRTIFWIIIGTIMIPGQVTVIPLFLLFTRGLGWHDSFWAIVLPQLAAPVGIFLMRQYIQSLPSQLEDAARIDGCGELGIFARVIVPLSKPILGVWAIFTFIGAWKAFLWPLIITNDQNLYMLEVGLKTLQFNAGPRNVGVVMAAALLASIPMVIVFFVFQRHLTRGLTIGGVKG